MDLPGPEGDRGLATRVLRDHLELRVGFRGFGTGTGSIAAMNELGQMLERHVRFEERELFPLIEARLDADAIAALGDEIEGFR